jgi:5,10-methylenetetrahydromethanopterin reductase
MTRLGAMLTRNHAPEDLPNLAKAMAPGLDELWIIEDLNFAGGISQLMAVLAATDNDASGRPRVGHGIAPAPFRNPAALAMEWATVEHLYPGRLIGGIGHGVPDWMDRVGEGVPSRLGLLRDTILSTKQILAGGSASYHGTNVHIDDVELVFPPTAEIPVLAGVTGPKSLHLSGEVADGTVLPEGFTADRIADARARTNAGREAAARTDPHYLTVFVTFYCGDVTQLPPPPPGVPLDGFAVEGPTVGDVIEPIQQLIDAGADSLIIIPFGNEAEQTRLLAKEIRPRLSPG